LEDENTIKKQNKNYWNLRRGVILTKDKLSGTGIEVLGVFSVINTKLSNTYSSSVASLDLYGQSAK
jgi:hypothetical protein